MAIATIVRHRARELPGSLLTFAAVEPRKDGDKRTPQRRAGQYLEDEIRDAEGHEVGVQVAARTVGFGDHHRPQYAEQARAKETRSHNGCRDDEPATRARRRSRGPDTVRHLPNVSPTVPYRSVTHSQDRARSEPSSRVRGAGATSVGPQPPGPKKSTKIQRRMNAVAIPSIRRCEARSRARLAIFERLAAAAAG